MNAILVKNRPFLYNGDNFVMSYAFYGLMGESKTMTNPRSMIFPTVHIISITSAYLYYKAGLFLNREMTYRQKIRIKCENMHVSNRRDGF